ncbi:MAG TPA: substrate-binding domain-containing protein [Candidatus Agathobaculum intestinigallinarum]|nr:substrate-binding domain-containing protein [Candidatus Agathobaculum intestinigallinarum]
MKKRLLAALMTSAMMVSMLAGCGSTGGETTTPEGGETAESGDGYSMTLIMSLRDEFLSTLEAGAQAAAEEAGVTLATQDAQNDTGKMLQFIESARNAGDDAVLINLVDAATAQQCIEAAGDMKVVFVNRVPEDTSVLTAGSSAAVVSNENQSGGYQGEFLANYFKEKGQTDVRYLMLQGTLGLVHTEQRSASVIQAMKDGGLNPIEAAAPLVADYDRAVAMDMISPLLTTTEFDCIIANNDAMALGAVEAMTAQGLDPTSIPIVGIDATVDGVQAIKDGTLAMTVFQDANGQGYGAVQAAVNLIEGNAINDGTDYETDETGNIVWVPFEPVTAENVADYE